MKDWPWYGYVVIAVIILGLFYFLWLKPKNTDLRILRDKRIKTEKEVVRLKQKKTELDQIEKELVSLAVTLKELEKVIPKNQEIDVILRRIQQLAYDTRLTIEKFVPKANINKEFYYEKPISIEITGTYHNLGIFFDRLSAFSRLFNVENFTIKALRKQSEASTISADWTAKTFIARDVQPTPEAKTKKKKRSRR